MSAALVEQNRADSTNRGVDVPRYVNAVDSRHGLIVIALESIVAGDSFESQFEYLIRHFVGVVGTEPAFDQDCDVLAAHCLATTGTPVFMPSAVQHLDPGIGAVSDFLRETMADTVTVRNGRT
jgi:hypothetical protein